MSAAKSEEPSVIAEGRVTSALLAEITPLHFYVACLEARNGELDAALDHLTEALRINPELAGAAADDHDLEELRNDPRFQTVVS